MEELGDAHSESQRPRRVRCSRLFPCWHARVEAPDLRAHDPRTTIPYALACAAVSRWKRSGAFFLRTGSHFVRRHRTDAGPRSSGRPRSRALAQAYDAKASGAAARFLTGISGSIVKRFPAVFGRPPPGVRQYEVLETPMMGNDWILMPISTPCSPRALISADAVLERNARQEGDRAHREGDLCPPGWRRWARP